MTDGSAGGHSTSPQPLHLPVRRDRRGALCAVEGARDVPFPIARAYWIVGVPAEASRGGHAHRSVREVVAAAAGSFVVRWEDARGREGEIRLRAPGEAVLLPPLVWRELVDFSPDAVCVVLASGPYDPGEYVNDLEEFRGLVQAR
jgi:dTDP-4-dehydrorhamnose 3,5-epimerase-like enzyme